jgi:acetyl esterase/lipase
LTSGDDADDNAEQQNLTSHVCDLMQHSWGLVSRPGFKTFSLKASRLLRGASVADRIEIAGVPCFVVSRHPCPELAAAIQCYKRKDRRRLPLQLSTINEHESTPSSPNAIPKKLFAGTNDRYRQQDVILHCTGGGFFAHMIAFDLLYLLDWSASTGAVIICPEFVLLPEKPFPGALQEVTRVYKSLVSGDAISTLGFEVNSIAITGESTGGNLAAALVTLCLSGEPSSILENPTKDGVQSSSPKSVSDSEDDYSFPESPGSTTGSGSEDQGESRPGDDIRMPDALMLSCPVLSMSLELSHSRVVGTDDPVLPSQVLNAISDAYLPDRLGISKTHPLASPMYAPDSVLSRFPPTLLFASSNDPLLDDSIAFNQRLRSLGVESEIRAVQNMPHAFWGLDLAGFPEAKQVHKEAKEWLAAKMRREKLSSV